MSRKIKTNQQNINEKDLMLRDTHLGKILFTKYREKMLALFLRDNRLLAAQVLSADANRIGSIYIGKVKNVVKHIDACFVEIAEGEICFLTMRDAMHPILFNRQFDGRILEGDEILVQITREAQKTKQASVTAQVSLANEYVVISGGARRIGYSGKLSKARRTEIHEWLTEAGMADMNMVIRTQAETCSKESLLQNIRSLYSDFQTMLKTASHRTCFSCIRPAPEAFEAALEQLAYPYEYEEIVTDDAILYSKLVTFCREKMSDKALRFYEDADFSLSKLYSLEQKMNTALETRIWLKSGGYLIIEHTEALTVIDVNSGKYEAKKASAYETVNMEAAEEIALQLRLRNLSGIIVVDFINMDSKEKESELLEYLREFVRKDKIKTNVIDITALGLVEITRKKQNRPLYEQLK